MEWSEQGKDELMHMENEQSMNILNEVNEILTVVGVEKKISHWKIHEVGEIEIEVKHQPVCCFKINNTYKLQLLCLECVWVWRNSNCIQNLVTWN